MIPFNLPTITGDEEKYLKMAINSQKLSGDGEFTKLCQKFMESKFLCHKVLLVSSGTAALDMAAILADIKPGDEVIMPSYTFTSTANAFVLRGAKIVFIDIRPDTMNLDEKLIEKAITKKTKAIVPVHYAGVGCEMDTILKIARKYHLIVIEDAAQGLSAKYNGRYLGTLGDIGCFSFHETKNYTCGEGGAIVINNKKLIERSEIIREKGTNRSMFFRGEIDKYTWVDVGSSFLMSDLSAAFLYAQLKTITKINANRLKKWQKYFHGLQPLADQGFIELPKIPSICQHNGHIFFVKTKNLSERTKLIGHLKKNKIMAVFHYIPLHSSPAGKKFGRLAGKDIFTTKESERLLRLPLYNQLSVGDMDKIIKSIKNFYDQSFR